MIPFHISLIKVAKRKGDTETIKHFAHNHTCILSDVAEYGDVEALTILIQAGADPTTDHCPIKRATQKGHKKAVELLLQSGASASPALRHAVAPCNSEILDLLLACESVDVHFEDDEALRLAACCGYAQTVRTLLEAGANPRAYCNEPMRLATKYLDFNVIDILQEYGASLTFQNYRWCLLEGYSADEMYARLSTYHKLAHLLVPYTNRHREQQRRGANNITFAVPLGAQPSGRFYSDLDSPS